MAPPCYALKVYSYDYYQWEEVLAVSYDPAKLREYHKTVDHMYNDAPLVEARGHRGLSAVEKEHWIIEEIPFLT